ncbi:hypothetical protein RRG08_047723 [Elysia crispata]|uniref:Uncharacterized protein n=1 Tax=Elysia crispata TaxID=231223 RepID=A0AAE1DVP7_9GAST|nr:hypothetical protein RRG08_047723 [Elysia crispata]
MSPEERVQGWHTGNNENIASQFSPKTLRKLTTATVNGGSFDGFGVLISPYLARKTIWLEHLLEIDSFISKSRGFQSGTGNFKDLDPTGSFITCRGCAVREPRDMARQHPRVRAHSHFRAGGFNLSKAISVTLTARDVLRARADSSSVPLQSQGNWATREKVTRLLLVSLHWSAPRHEPALHPTPTGPQGWRSRQFPGRSTRLSDHSNTPGNLNIVSLNAGAPVFNAPTAVSSSVRDVFRPTPDPHRDQFRLLKKFLVRHVSFSTLAVGLVEGLDTAGRVYFTSGSPSLPDLVMRQSEATVSALNNAKQINQSPDRHLAKRPKCHTIISSELSH